jgi:hypothetical protein
MVYGDAAPGVKSDTLHPPLSMTLDQRVPPSVASRRRLAALVALKIKA